MLTTRLAWETLDGGATWHRLAAPLTDYTDVAITRAGTYLSTGHGVRFLPRGAHAWVPRPGPRTPAFFGYDASSDTLLAHADGTLWRSRRGRPFRRLQALGMGRVRNVEVTVGAGGRTVVVSSGVVALSTDGGASFAPISPPAFGIVPSVERVRRLVGASFEGIQVSGNAGRSWAVRYPSPVTDVGVDPAHPGRWYALTLTRRLLVSTDDGSTWRAVAVLPGPELVLGTQGLLGFGRDRLWVVSAGGLVWTRRDVAPGLIRPTTDFSRFPPHG